MSKKFYWVLIMLLIGLAGCSAAATPPSIPTPIVVVITVIPTAQPSINPTAQPTINPTSEPTIEPATATPQPIVATSAPIATPDGTSIDQSHYLDDRSSPGGVILSLFNAVNRHEYVRAYTYWENDPSGTNVPPFDQFQQGYQDTDSVQVTLGVIGSDAGAGQIYYAVPVVLKAKNTGGQVQSFAGCYTLHLSNPGIQSEPPFQPMSIKSAVIEAIDNAVDPNTALMDACPATGNPIEPVPPTDPITIAASNYLDDRSTPIGTLRSLFNAINRHEYARAYSYWMQENNLSNVPPFDQFQQGYQNTATVEASFGDPQGDAAMSHVYTKVPTTLKVQTTDGQTQTFAGCYLIVYVESSVITEPPTPTFQDMNIQQANLQQISGPVTSQMLTDACNSLP